MAQDYVVRPGVELTRKELAAARRIDWRHMGRPVSSLAFADTLPPDSFTYGIAVFMAIIFGMVSAGMVGQFAGVTSGTVLTAVAIAVPAGIAGLHLAAGSALTLGSKRKARRAEALAASGKVMPYPQKSPAASALSMASKRVLGLQSSLQGEMSFRLSLELYGLAEAYHDKGKLSKVDPTLLTEAGALELQRAVAANTTLIGDLEAAGVALAAEVTQAVVEEEASGSGEQVRAIAQSLALSSRLAEGIDPAPAELMRTYRSALAELNAPDFVSQTSPADPRALTGDQTAPR